MSRDKQIEELAKVIFDENNKEALNALSMALASSAEALYNAGYRKSADVAEEIFAEIDSCIFPYSTHDIFSSTKYAELKKKYIGKDTNVRTNTED